MSPADLAARIGTDPKTVERWITQGRRPHPGTRAHVAQVLERDETYLWPELLADPRTQAVSQAELVALWPARSLVPADVWSTLLGQARERVEVLVYAAGFLFDTHQLPTHLERVSSAGGTSRLLLGDSSSPALEQRGRDEGLPNVPGRAASALEYLGAAARLPGVQVRLHATPLYVSLVRVDDTILANLHTHGIPAKDSPVMQLTKVPGGQLFAYYEAAFDRVWEQAKPVP